MNWDEHSLRSANGFCTLYEQWYIDRGWRIARSDGPSGEAREGQYELVELHDDVMETIIRKEELVLSESDEVSFGVQPRCTVGTQLTRDTEGSSFKLRVAGSLAVPVRVALLHEDMNRNICTAQVVSSGFAIALLSGQILYRLFLEEPAASGIGAASGLMLKTPFEE